MKNILLSPPNYFNVNYIINPWMKNKVGTVDFNLANSQWNNLKSLISKLALTNFLFCEEPNLPDVVFTANAGILINDTFVNSCFNNVERKPESAIFAKYFNSIGKRVDNFFVENNIPFEGAGDALYSKKHNIYTVSYGFRTSKLAFNYLNKLFTKVGSDSIQVELVDDRFYHLDTCFCPLDNGSILIYLPAFSNESVLLLEQTYGNDLIPVSDIDAANFACNALSLGNYIILNECSDSLFLKLNSVGLTVIKSPTSEFMKSGGSVKCLTLDISQQI